MRVYSYPYANNIYHLSIDCLIDNLTVITRGRTNLDLFHFTTRVPISSQSPSRPNLELLNYSFRSKNYLIKFLLNNSSFVIFRLIRRSEEKGEEKGDFANKRL